MNIHVRFILSLSIIFSVIFGGFYYEVNKVQASQALDNAQAEKARLENELATLEQEIASKQQELNKQKVTKIYFFSCFL